VSYQQINLYQPVFRKQQKVFSAVAMLQGLAIIAIGMVCLFGYALWRGHTLDAQLKQAEQQRNEAAKRMEQLRVQLPQRAKTPELEAEVETLRKELAGRQRIAARLAATDAGNTRGFADYLEGLARQKPSSLWLTDVDVRHGGQELVLRGSTLQPEQLPRYIQRLGQEPAFAGREFSDLNIAQPEKEKGRYDFVMSTHALDAKEEKSRESAP
jgi:Tfp pilus assembly protein PilN